MRGFRPVPLYDGAPGFNALIDVGPIIGALQKSAIELGNLDLRPDAPPVFLLDSRRTDFGSFVSPGKFDNRWAIFPQDFPSANFLLSRGIRSILLAQQAIAQPLPDLAHALLRWQEARLAILACGALANNPPLVLADEPTGNLDSRSGEEIMALLHRLHAQGTTIVMVTHDSKIAAHTQRTINLMDGLVDTVVHNGKSHPVEVLHETI